jgi:hypothetical protein
MTITGAVSKGALTALQAVKLADKIAAPSHELNRIRREKKYDIGSRCLGLG